MTDTTCKLSGPGSGACEGPIAFQIVTRTADRSKVLDTQGPCCINHGVGYADRAYTAGSIAAVDVEPLPAPHATGAGQAIEWAQHRLQSALAALANGESDAALGNVEQALMALHWAFGTTGPVVLSPADVAELLRGEPEPECLCPPGLVDRGGFRSGCPVHHLT